MKDGFVRCKTGQLHVAWNDSHFSARRHPAPDLSQSAMPIEFKCESCSKLLRVPEGSGGKQCQCPGCSALLNIPSDRAATPVTSPAANSGGSVIALCIPCPKCKHELICDPSLVGTKGQCRNCKHIFVISDLPSNAAPSAEQTIHWVFSCPKCSQLFEGNEAMRGRRGKCHVCGEVFAIEVRVADATRGEKSSHLPSSFDDDDLTLGVLPNEVAATRESVPRTRPQAKPAASSGTAASRENLPPIQFNCASCAGRMEVPGAAARQLTHCPHCNRQLTIPATSRPTPDSLAANDPWADFSFGSATYPTPPAHPFGDTPLGNSPLGNSLYSPSMSTAPMPPGSKRSSGGKASQFITCGIFIAVCALIGIAIETYYIVIGSLAMFRMPNMGQEQFIVISIYMTVA